MTTNPEHHTKFYRLPPVFINDHWARALPEEGYSRQIKETKSHVWVEMDLAAYVDLHSDARYYCEDQGWSYDLRGLQSSARATLRALDLQGPPPNL